MPAASKHIHWQETKISDIHLGHWFYADTNENNKSKSFHWKQSHIMIAKIKKNQQSNVNNLHALSNMVYLLLGPPN